MYIVTQKNLRILLLTIVMQSGSCLGLTQEARDKGFVRLDEVDPTIITSARYNSDENFLGRPVDGYKKSVVVLTKQAAEALKCVQEQVKKDGFSLVVYDGYRPQRGPNNFMAWSKDIADQCKKCQYYPRVNKADVFKLGYVAEKSGHSRGSTVDLTIIKLGENVRPIEEKTRMLLDGFTIPILDDGTVDMGSSFDLFDTVSHYENDLIPQEFKERRAYLNRVMGENGFKGYSKEWWHFTLKNEPYPADRPDSYFDFTVE